MDDADLSRRRAFLWEGRPRQCNNIATMDTVVVPFLRDLLAGELLAGRNPPARRAPTVPSPSGGTLFPQLHLLSAPFVGDGDP